MRSAGGGYEKKSFALPTQEQRGQQIVVLVVAVVGCGRAGRIVNLPWVVSTRSLGLKRLSTLGPCLVTGPLSTTASSSERNDDGSGSGGTSRHGPTRSDDFDEVDDEDDEDDAPPLPPAPPAPRLPLPLLPKSELADAEKRRLGLVRRALPRSPGLAPPPSGAAAALRLRSSMAVDMASTPVDRAQRASS